MRTDDGEQITSKMPADETVVEVELKDGSTQRAWFSRNIAEDGDWDFLPAGNTDGPIEDADSIADEVVAWRPLQ